MRLFLLLLILVAMCQLAMPGEVGRENTSLALLVITDWLQTREIARDPSYAELNPILGNSPSTGSVDTYFLAGGALYLIAQTILPEHYRDGLRRLLLTSETICVSQNIAIGVRF